MNLGRAKLILIIAFTGLNLFLGYHLFWPDFGRLTKAAISAEDIRLAEETLNENNFFLGVSLDRSIRTSNFLAVSPARDIQQKLAGSLIEKGARAEGAENITYFHLEGETAALHAGGLTQLFFDPGILLTESVTNFEDRDLIDAIEIYLAENDLMPEGICFDYLEETEDGRILIHYYQEYDGLPIFAGQLKVVIEDGYILAIEIYWLKPVERVPVREIKVISAAEALINLVNELGASVEPRTIKKIDLGYFSTEYDAEKWEIPPVWRVVLDDMQYYYVNAFTGNIEQDTIVPEQL